MKAESIKALEHIVDEFILRGAVEVNNDNVDPIIEACRELTWSDVTKTVPEALPKYEGRKAIPCMVVVAPPPSRPGRKARVTVAQRQWNGNLLRWEWSRNLNVIGWRELPEA